MLIINLDNVKWDSAGEFHETDSVVFSEAHKGNISMCKNIYINVNVGAASKIPVFYQGNECVHCLGMSNNLGLSLVFRVQLIS